MEKTSRMIATIAGLATIIGTAGCTSGLEVGDSGVARNTVQVTTDFNSSSFIKPSCTIIKGQPTEIIGTSELYDGTPLLEVRGSHCKGFIEDSLNAKRLLGIED